MGRLVKKGLDYFNVDCNQEDNLTLVEAKHGIAGYGIVVKLWKKCYQIQGYYAQWDEKNMLLFAREIAVDIALLKSVIETCFDEEIFSRRLYEEYKILTSSGVQKRWKKIVTDAKRKDCSIDPLFDLFPLITVFTPEEIGINSKKTGTIPVEKPNTPEESTQSKVKESKEDKSNPENTGAPEAPPSDPAGRKRKKTRENFVPPTTEQMQAYFLKLMGKKWSEARCRNTADACLDHYVANGWVQNKGKPIVDWPATARQWIRRDLNGDFARQPSSKSAAPIPSPVPSIPELSKTQIEINYLYERYHENPGSITVISIDPQDYNFLKTSSLLRFSLEETDRIKAAANSYIVETQLEPTGDVQLRFMKKFGVLEFFKQLKANGKETVFELRQLTEKI